MRPLKYDGLSMETFYELYSTHMQYNGHQPASKNRVTWKRITAVIKSDRSQLGIRPPGMDSDGVLK